MKSHLKSRVLRSRSIFGAVMLGALMAAQSASALSCARPNLVDVLEEVKASPKLYYILTGQFEQRKQTRRTRHWPNKAYDFGQQVKITQTHCRGASLGERRKVDQRLNGFPVNIQTSCAGPWCSKPPSPNKPVIAFVEMWSDRGVLLKIGPCPKYVFDATPENIQTIRACLNNTCVPKPGRW